MDKIESPRVGVPNENGNGFLDLVPAIDATLRRRGLNPSDRDDARQLALLCLHRHRDLLGQMTPKARAAYARRVAKGVAINMGRGRRDEETYVSGETPAFLLKSLLSPESRLEHQRRLRALADHLRALATRERAVVEMVELAEQPVAKVAQTLGIPEGTVKSRLRRGREQLLQLFRRT
jgi:RNA polymerase sigma-70 factor (ECF subfamily)